MKKETFDYAVRNLLSRKLRSWLTVVSILIGIMAIFALVSFGAGVQNYVNEISEEMGINKLLVQPGGFSAPGSSTIEFGESDLRVIERTKGIGRASPVFMIQSEARYDQDRMGKWAYVMGLPTSGDGMRLAKETFTLKLESGRELKSQDKYKAVLGYNYQLENEIFEKPLKIGDSIYIRDIQFKIVGFYDSLGNPGDDSNIYIPIDTAQEVFDNSNYQMIIAEMDDTKDSDQIVSRVEKDLRRSRGLEEGKEDFVVQTFEDAMAVFTNVIGVLNAVLVLIAMISVVVSAINIANSMYTSVIERTNEIGVMKAIGAKNSEIRNVFIVESGLLGLIGGAFGIILGFLIARLGGNIAAEAGYSALQPIFPLWLIFGCLMFSFLVGMLSGYFPAKQASELKPVEALRYE